MARPSFYRSLQRTFSEAALVLPGNLFRNLSHRQNKTDSVGFSAESRILCYVGIVAAILLASLPSVATDFEVQAEKSRVRFEVGHSDYAKPVRGRFASVSGEISYEVDRPGEMSGLIVVDASSIDTDNGYRDEHLRTSFFESDRFPEIRFRIDRVFSEERRIEGELTMRGVTRPVALETSNLHEVEGPSGRRILRARASGLVDRREFGIEEDADRTQGLGKLLSHIQEGLDDFIDDEVQIRISIVAYEITEGPDHVPASIRD